MQPNHVALTVGDAAGRLPSTDGISGSRAHFGLTSRVHDDEEHPTILASSDGSLLALRWAVLDVGDGVLGRLEPVLGLESPVIP